MDARYFSLPPPFSTNMEASPFVHPFSSRLADWGHDHVEGNEALLPLHSAGSVADNKKTCVKKKLFIKNQENWFSWIWWNFLHRPLQWRAKGQKGLRRNCRRSFCLEGRAHKVSWWVETTPLLDFAHVKSRLPLLLLVNLLFFFPSLDCQRLGNGQSIFSNQKEFEKIKSCINFRTANGELSNNISSGIAHLDP